MIKYNLYKILQNGLSKLNNNNNKLPSDMVEFYENCGGITVSYGNGDYLTIDLSDERLGRCYDSYWDRHGVVGECPIIKRIFEELLEIYYLTKDCGGIG